MRGVSVGQGQSEQNKKEKRLCPIFLWTDLLVSSCRVHRSLIRKLYTRRQNRVYIIKYIFKEIPFLITFVVKLLKNHHSLLNTRDITFFFQSKDILFFYFATALFNCEISKAQLLQNFLRNVKLLSNYWVAIWKCFHFPKSGKLSAALVQVMKLKITCHPVIHYVREWNLAVASNQLLLHLLSSNVLQLLYEGIFYRIWFDLNS